MTGAVFALTVVLAVALLLPLYRVIRGPTVFDRMIGVGVIGNKTVILVCFVGYLFGRLDMFIDIALAYAMLNFLSAVVVAKYLDGEGGDRPDEPVPVPEPAGASRPRGAR